MLPKEMTKIMEVNKNKFQFIHIYCILKVKSDCWKENRLYVVKKEVFCLFFFFGLKIEMNTWEVERV